MNSRIKILNTMILMAVTMCVTIYSLTAQKDQKLPAIDYVDEYAVVDPSLDNKAEESIKERVKTMVQQYAYSSNFGEYTGEFSSEKYEMFSKLFTNNARLTNYILKKPIQEETFKYTGFIYDNIRPKSIDQKFRNGELLSIEKDASGNYRCTVVISLDVNSIFDDKTKKLTSSPKARRVNLKGLAILEPGNIEGGSFVEMGGGGPPPPDSKITLNVGALYGVGTLSGGTNEQKGFSDVKPTSNSLGLYADISKSVGAPGKWFIWAGLGYQSISINTDLTGKYEDNLAGTSRPTDVIERTVFTTSNTTTPFITGNKTSNVFISAINSGEENISGAALLSGALGIGFQKKIGTKNMLMIKVGLVPTYFSGVSKGNRSLNFEGYELPQFSRFPDIKELTDNKVRNDYNYNSNNAPGVERVITADNNFSLSALIAPSLQIPIGFNWGLDLGLAYSLGINNLFKHTPSDNNFLGRPDESKSIIQDFLPTSKHNQLQVRAGVFLNLN